MNNLPPFAVGRRSFLAATSLLLSGGAFAQDGWPGKHVIDWVIPYPPGGSTDVLGRAVAQRVAAALGTTIIVENRAGATGTIGGNYVAKAAPDGFTVLHTTIGAQTISPHLLPKLPYEPLRDLQPVANLGTFPDLLVVGVNQPFRTVAELVAAAKSKPGSVSFASGGNGTILHIQGELLKQQTGAQFIHVPYKGDTPALTDTMAGVTHFMFAPAAAALPYVQSGKLRALPATSARRLKDLPAVPTMTEAGFHDFIVEQWQAVYLPAKTPAPIVQRLNAEIDKALHDPSVLALAQRLGIALVGGTPQQLAQLQQSDSAKWAKVIRDGHIHID
jgi:tripartite-type tricarboxylate transporter receptor subunit TctC